MCGIAGIIYRDGSRDIGREMTAMLQSMKHRGPDSTGYALFGPPSKTVVMRYKLADANDARDYEFAERLERNRAEVESRLGQLGARVDRGRGGDRLRPPRHARVRRRPEDAGRLR